MFRYRNSTNDSSHPQPFSGTTNRCGYTASNLRSARFDLSLFLQKSRLPKRILLTLQQVLLLHNVSRHLHLLKK